MSDVVIASNQSIKTQMKRKFETITGAGTFDVILAEASQNSYIEMHHVKISGNSQAGVLLVDVASGLTLASELMTSGGGGVTFLMSRFTEGLNSNTLVSGTGATNSRSLVIPNGCRLVGRLTQSGGVNTNAMIAIGIEFINSP